MKTRFALILATIVAAIMLVASPALAATGSITAPASADVGEVVTATVTLTDVPIIVIWDLDWGDGDSDTNFSTEGTYQRTHQYQQPGDYTITITVDGVDSTAEITINTYEGSFADDDTSIFVNHIEWLAAEGVTKGCNPPHNTLFCPKATVTRGQMAAFLSRALGYTAAPDAGFTDTVGHLFETDINKLAAVGVTKGCNPSEGNTEFCPNDPVTRGQMAAFLSRALGYTAAPDAGFTDTVGHTFEKDINKLAAAGVTVGCNPSEGNTNFCPNDPVTRGQMAAFLRRALDT